VTLETRTAAPSDGAQLLARVAAAVHQRVVGQQETVHALLIALLTGGHVLLEGLPGLAKTLMVRSLADAVNASFRRIQFTPDLLPGDIVGTTVYEQASGQFLVHKGPIFAHVVLADEINRAPPKVQSALLEAMEEKQVTLAGDTYRLDEPFLVLATQNPVEHHGTYPLAEAQLDRFMMKLLVAYPSRAEEKEIVRRGGMGTRDIRSIVRYAPAATIPQLFEARGEMEEVHLSEPVLDYIVELVFATREPAAYRLAHLEGLLEFGGSPRATLFLTRAARANAWLAGRPYVIADDVKAVAHPVLRHRLRTTYEADAKRIDADRIIEQILGAVPAP
jgi:MoxR-like ATPase